MGEFYSGESGQAVQDKLEKQFEVGAQSELKIESLSGIISIQAQEGTAIIVQARRAGSSRTLRENDLEFSHLGSRLSVESSAGPGGTAPVEFDVVVPRDCSIEAQTTAGEVRIEGVRGGIRVDSASGNVSCLDIGGYLKAETASGRVEIRASYPRGFDLDTASGDLTVEAFLTPGERYHIETASGDVELRLPGGVGATIQAETASGDIECSLPAEMIAEHSHAGHREWAGRVNGGGAEVDISSISGDIRIGTGGALLPEPDLEAAPSEATAVETRTFEEPMQSGTHGDTTAVLSALERGEITVEEAMERLDEQG